MQSNTPRKSPDRSDLLRKALSDLTQQHERLLQGLSILREIDDFDDPSLPIDEIFRRLVDTLTRGVNAENGSLMLLDESGESLELRAASSPLEAGGRSYPPGGWQGRKFRFGEGLVGRAAETGKAIRTSDVRAEPGFEDLLTSPIHVRSLLSYPFQDGGGTIGVLNLSHPSPGIFTQDSESLVALVAHRVVRLIRSHRHLLETQRAAEERARLFVAIEQSAEATMITDAKGIIRYVNPAFVSMTGYSREETVGNNLPALRGETDGWKAYGDVWSNLRQGKVWTGTLTRQRKNGEVYYEESTVSPVRDASGEMVSYVTVSRDTTHVRHLEAHLRQAQKLEAIGALAGGIAHDFNNILHTMLGYTRLALDDTDPKSPAYEDLTEVLNGGERAVDLIRRILVFSRKSTSEVKPTNVAQVVGDTTKLLRGMLPSTIAFEQHFADCGIALADPTDLHQVVMNLCTNAFHAMEEHGGTLTVRMDTVQTPPEDVVLAESANHGPFARLQVSDTGHGMTPEVLARIFDPYFTTKDVGKGTGLGLPTVHGIVRRYGGDITVRSQPGKGSTFDVYLPVQVPSAATSALLRPEAERAYRGVETILFVDDEESITHLARHSLERLGYKVEAFASSVAALETFRFTPGRFDIVVSDQTMPRMTGIELAHEIRQLRPGIPIILCSGYSEGGYQEKLSAEGVDLFLLKPILPIALATAIRRVLDSRSPTHTAPPAA